MVFVREVDTNVLVTRVVPFSVSCLFLRFVSFYSLPLYLFLPCSLSISCLLSHRFLLCIDTLRLPSGFHSIPLVKQFANVSFRMVQIPCKTHACVIFKRKRERNYFSLLSSTSLHTLNCSTGYTYPSLFFFFCFIFENYAFLAKRVVSLKIVLLRGPFSFTRQTFFCIVFIIS